MSGNVERGDLYITICVVLVLIRARWPLPWRDVALAYCIGCHSLAIHGAPCMGTVLVQPVPAYPRAQPGRPPCLHTSSVNFSRLRAKTTSRQGWPWPVLNGSTRTSDVTQLLNNDEFAQVVRNAPLVAIDLIIRDPEQCVLVGLRMNEPANLCPAVRADAFVRIVKAETGLEASIGDANSSASMSTCTTLTYSGRRGSARTTLCWLTSSTWVCGRRL